LRDRIARRLVSAGVMGKSTALIETIGRRSGQPRVTPVTNGLDGNTFWIVTEHGRKANYVRNLEAYARVRVKATKRWRSGTAQFVDDDPHATLDRIVELNPSARANAAIVRKDATELLVIRIDLD
jgi:deazaflavin-dependent oxidoreductase (nitroreductase family)